MKLPRDLSGQELAKALSRLGYAMTHQRGSHMRLTTNQNGEHHVTIPDQNALRTGTLSAIINDVAGHFALTRDEPLERLFA